MGKLGSFLLGALTGVVALGAVSYFVATAGESQCHALDDGDDTTSEPAVAAAEE